MILYIIIKKLIISNNLALYLRIMLATTDRYFDSAIYQYLRHEYLIILTWLGFPNANMIRQHLLQIGVVMRLDIRKILMVNKLAFDC